MSIKVKSSDGALIAANLIFGRSDGKSIVEYTEGALKGVRGMVENNSIIHQTKAKAGALDAKLQALSNMLESFNVDNFDTADAEGFNNAAQNALQDAMLKLSNVIAQVRRAADQNRKTGLPDLTPARRETSRKAFGESSLPNAKRALEELSGDLPSIASEADNDDPAKSPYVTKLDGQIDMILDTIERLMR